MSGTKSWLLFWGRRRKASSSCEEIKPQLLDFKGSFTGEHTTGLAFHSVTLTSMQSCQQQMNRTWCLSGSFQANSSLLGMKTS